MDLISVAQKTGEVSADAYTEAYHQAQGMLPPPQMMGIEEMVDRLQLADAESNPFASEGNGGRIPQGGGWGLLRRPIARPWRPIQAPSHCATSSLPSTLGGKLRPRCTLQSAGMLAAARCHLSSSGSSCR